MQISQRKPSTMAEKRTEKLKKLKRAQSATWWTRINGRHQKISKHMWKKGIKWMYDGRCTWTRLSRSKNASIFWNMDNGRKKNKLFIIIISIVFVILRLAPVISILISLVCNKDPYEYFVLSVMYFCINLITILIC